jgi:sortase A
MLNPQAKTGHLLNKPDLNILLLMGAVLFFMALASSPAISAPDQIETEIPAQAQGFDLNGYMPDQSLWSEKMKLKYEQVKLTDEPPLALLKIERLNLEAPVYHGTKRVTLDRGLGSVEGTALPGEVGNIAISGHRDSFFRVLKDIRLGDTIEMRTQDGVEDFEVSQISIVDALEVSVLDPTDSAVLTLITCHPFYYEGYAPDRYIVRATPVSRQLN